MKPTFILEANTGIDAEVETRFCALLTDAVDLWKCGEFRASLDLLAEVEPMVELVSDDRRGRFYNSRAAALQSLGEHDEATIEFSGAAFHFEKCGDIRLQAIVMNNAALSYGLLGDYIQAHESVDKAISLVSDKELLAEFHHQKHLIYLDEIKHQNGASLLPMSDKEDKTSDRVKNIGGKQESVLLDRVGCGPQSLGEDSAMQTAFPSGRTGEIIEHLTGENDGKHALEIMELLYRSGGKDRNNPNTYHEIRWLATQTKEFDQFVEGLLSGFDEPDSISEVPS